MHWPGYSPCCYKSALKPEAAFCGDCGTPLLRCLNFAECLQLVAPNKPCGVCLDPELVIEAGASIGGGVGARVALPLKLRNSNSQAPRPIYLKALTVRSSGGPARPTPLDWEMVEPGAERSFVVEAGPFERAGTERLELTLTIAMRSKDGYEEAYVFGGALLLQVAPDDKRKVDLKFDLSGAQFERNALLKTDFNVPEFASAAGGATLEERQVVALERLEKLELQSGVRGYADSRLRAPRSATFSFVGFPEADAPGYGVGLGPRGAVAFGRSGRETDPATNPTPMDVSLRAYNANGAVDLEASSKISRHHFDLLVLNDRVCLHARSAQGALLNGAGVASGAVAPLSDGDVITPTRSSPLSLRIGLLADPQNWIENVVVTAERKGGAK